MSSHDTHVPPHLRYQTKLSLTGERNMLNRKPFRTAAQKRLARSRAVKCDDGAWRTDSPVSYHSKPMDR